MVNILSYVDADGNLVQRNQRENNHNPEIANLDLSDQLGFKTVGEFIKENDTTVKKIVRVGKDRVLDEDIFARSY